jgi:hypothetical protein
MVRRRRKTLRGKEEEKRVMIKEKGRAGEAQPLYLKPWEEEYMIVCSETS